MTKRKSSYRKMPDAPIGQQLTPAQLERKLLSLRPLMATIIEEHTPTLKTKNKGRKKLHA